MIKIERVFFYNAFAITCFESEFFLFRAPGHIP